MPLLIFFAGIFIYAYCEISLLILIASKIGVIPLILLMIAISVVGVWVIKLRGLFTLNAIRQQLAQGQVPTQAVVSSLLFAIAGVLLIIPGMISDILALLLVMPFTRNWFTHRLMQSFKSRVKFTTFHRSAYSDNTTFDAEFERKQDEDKWIK